MTIIPLYAAGLAVMYVVLALRIVVIRRGERISLGWGKNDILQRRVRIHGNFAEYVPFALLLLAMAEIRGAAPFYLHALAGLLVVARLGHAYALSQDPPKGLACRGLSVIATFAVLLGAAALIAVTA